MTREEFKRQIEGYDDIRQEIEVLRKYGHDYTVGRGLVARMIDQRHPRQLNLKVSEIRTETKTAKTLRLVADDTYLPPFQAGQYISLVIETAGIRTSRPYSIASPPNQTGYYDLTVRRVADGFVSNFLLDRLKVGDRLTSSAPVGNFYYNPLIHGRDLVFLAGGSGITPLMSMIREITDRDLDRQIHLIYGSRHTDDIIFWEELADRAGRHDQLTVHHVLSEPEPAYQGRQGLITADG